MRKRERLFKSRRQRNPIIVHILYLCLIRIFFFLSILKPGAFPFLSFLLRSFQLSAASSLCNHRVFRSIPSLLDSHKFTDRLSLIPWWDFSIPTSSFWVFYASVWLFFVIILLWIICNTHFKILFFSFKFWNSVCSFLPVCKWVSSNFEIWVWRYVVLCFSISSSLLIGFMCFALLFFFKFVFKWDFLGWLGWTWLCAKCWISIWFWAYGVKKQNWAFDGCWPPNYRRIVWFVSNLQSLLLLLFFAF